MRHRAAAVAHRRQRLGIAARVALHAVGQAGLVGVRAPAASRANDPATIHDDRSPCVIAPRIRHSPLGIGADERQERDAARQRRIGREQLLRPVERRRREQVELPRQRQVGRSRRGQAGGFAHRAAQAADHGCSVVEVASSAGEPSS